MHHIAQPDLAVFFYKLSEELGAGVRHISQSAVGGEMAEAGEDRGPAGEEIVAGVGIGAGHRCGCLSHGSPCQNGDDFRRADLWHCERRGGIGS